MSINYDLEKTGIANRVGLTVYLKSPCDQFKLRRYGDIVYFSTKFSYSIIYINQDDSNEIVAKLESLPFVKQVECSQQAQIDLDSKHIEDQITTLAAAAEQELEQRQEQEREPLE